VLLTAHTSPGEPGDGYWYGVGTLENSWNSEPVDCNDINPACFTNWGAGNWYVTNAGMTDYTTGSITGFNAPRRADHIVSTFADGHAKAASTGSLAVGTNYSPTLNANSIAITDINIYHWTAQ
jgi:hypothetical protein